MDVLSPILLIPFWSAVLSFIPVTLYLLFVNPPLNQIEQERLRGIYVLKKDSRLLTGKKSRSWNVALIYGICFFLLTFVYFFNRTHYGHADVSPFNILSSVAIMFFWFSILSYLPFAIYLFSKDPWKAKEEGICLTRIYIAQGICILFFCVIYAYLWLKKKNMLVGIEEVLAALLITIFAAVVISYVPILAYVFFMFARQKGIRTNSIFIIYSLCFLVFSAVYIKQWVINKKIGMERRPLKYYFEIR
ncbi:MAG: hypothetical protein A2787_09185 [Omnitrophica WOR_2 bacterium RIFCSPHIGHO2_01_FULL_48_9]|nr:MAG: hypothetical protein A3D10_04690 [Omnitrophica WOR_2 bacterium RIFCSPHIGHO2_02_FULL_48_11]OGX34307.1 MAG: hypothetical protein A2787_09185 [Omnitrophica WOR_2 bacterium RIFCSPHIGHO2_01_FULL_48_9]